MIFLKKNEKRHDFFEKAKHIYVTATKTMIIKT